MDYIRFDRTTRDIGGIVDRTDVPRRDMDVYHEKMTGGHCTVRSTRNRDGRGPFRMRCPFCVYLAWTRVSLTLGTCGNDIACVLRLVFWMWRMIFHFREYSSRHFFLMIFFVTIRNSNCCCTVRECVHCGTKKFA